MEGVVHRSTSDSKRKIVVIGVDGAEPSLLDRWMQSGDLPNFVALHQRSLSGRTKNPYALEAGAAWPVFHTGLLPGNQPLFDGQRYFDRETYSYRWHGADSVRPLLWERLSEQGKRCLVIDTPYVRLNKKLNGIMVLDYAAHVAANGQKMEFQSHPEWVRDEVLELFGGDPTEGRTCDSRRLQSAADYRSFIADYLLRIEKKADLTCHLIDKEPWDFVETVFTDLHCMGHHLWHINDPDHPKYNAQLHKEFGDPMREGFIALDKAVGRILDRLDERTTVLFYMSHGMGPQNTGTGLLDRVLAALDTEREAPSDAGGTVKSHLMELWQKVPGEVRGSRFLRAIRKPFAGALTEPKFLPNPQERRFFEVYANNATGGVRLNIVGREAHGIVKPEDAPAILKDLRAAILECRNAETGEPFVADCVITREHYSGVYKDYLPDMLINWNRSASIRAVESPRFGVIRQRFDGYRTGDHTPFGKFVCAGPGIEPRILNQDVNVEDFVPTILAHLSCQHEDLDGHAHPTLLGMPDVAPA